MARKVAVSMWTDTGEASVLECLSSLPGAIAWLFPSISTQPRDGGEAWPAPKVWSTHNDSPAGSICMIIR